MSTKQQAEVKPFKVGEPSADNAGGNPEPSTAKYAGACVETGRRVCVGCGGEIPSTKQSNAIYCSAACRSLHHAYKTGRIKQPGVGSGGAQWGEWNSQFKDGRTAYRSNRGTFCERCGSKCSLDVHHIDGDRSNNDLSNLETLCRSCHRKHHGNQWTKGT